MLTVIDRLVPWYSLPTHPHPLLHHHNHTGVGLFAGVVRVGGSSISFARTDGRGTKEGQGEERQLHDYDKPCVCETYATRQPATPRR